MAFGNLEFTIDLNDKEFRARLQESLKNFDQLEKKVTDTQASISKSVNGLNGVSLSGFGSAFQTAGSTISGVGDRIIGTVASITAGVAGLGAGLVGFGIKTASELQTTRASFDTLTGSVEVSKDLFRDFQKFGKDSPFEFGEISKAGKTLLGFGRTAEQVKGDVRVLGDIAGATGANYESLAVVFGQVNATGRLMGGDALQLINNSIPITSILAKKLGVSVQEVKEQMEKGAISADLFNQALVDSTKEGGFAFNGMANQAKTLSGILSTVKDNSKQLLLTLVGFTAEGDLVSGGLFDTISKAFAQFNTEEVQKKLQDLATRVGKSIQTIIQYFTDFSKGESFLAQGLGLSDESSIVSFLSRVREGIFAIIDLIQGDKASASGHIANLIGVGEESKITKFIEKILNLIGKLNGTQIVGIAGLAISFAPLLSIGGRLISVIGTIASAISTLTPIIAGITASVSLPVVAIGALVAGIVLLGIRFGTFQKILDGIKPSLDKIYQGFLTVWNGISQIDFAGLFNNFLAIVDKLKPVFDVFASIIVNLINSVIDVFASWFAQLQAVFNDPVVQSTITEVGNNMVVVFNAVMEAINFLTPIIGGLINWIINLVAEFLKLLPLGDILKTLIIGIGGTFNLLISYFKFVIEYVGGWFNLLKALFTGNWGEVGGIVTNAGNNIYNIVSSLMSRLGEAVTTALNGLKDMFINFGNGLVNTGYDMGKNLINGMISGVKNLAGNLKNAITGAVSNIKLPTLSLPSISFPKFAEGGVAGYSTGGAVGSGVDQTNSDSVLARLTRGEGILTTDIMGQIDSLFRNISALSGFPQYQGLGNASGGGSVNVNIANVNATNVDEARSRGYDMAYALKNRTNLRG